MTVLYLALKSPCASRSFLAVQFIVFSGAVRFFRCVSFVSCVALRCVALRCVALRCKRFVRFQRCPRSFSPVWSFLASFVLRLTLHSLAVKSFSPPRFSDQSLQLADLHSFPSSRMQQEFSNHEGLEGGGQVVQRMREKVALVA